MKDPEYVLCNELKNKGVQDVWFSTNDKRDYTFIQFYCGGKGSDNYYGFYYVDDDTPVGREGIRDELKKTASGWQEGYNDYYTERIKENWFYYEKHF